MSEPNLLFVLIICKNRITLPGPVSVLAGPYIQEAGSLLEYVRKKLCPIISAIWVPRSNRLDYQMRCANSLIEWMITRYDENPHCLLPRMTAPT